METSLCIDSGKHVWSYAAFHARADAVAGHLGHLGLASRSAVAIVEADPAEFYARLFGVWKAGHVAIPISLSVPETDRAELLRRAGPAYVLPAEIAAGGGGDGIVFSDDEIAVVLFTSGSTGLPKGICHTRGALFRNADLSREILRLTHCDRLFVNTPPYFTSSILHFLSVYRAGGALLTRRGFFFGDRLLETLAELGATGFGGAPAHLSKALASNVAIAPSLRFWVTSGDHLPVTVAEDFVRRFPAVELYPMYGLTEVAGRLCSIAPGEILASPGSVGRPIGEMKIEVDSEGQIWVSGPMLFRGYWNGDGSVTPNCERFATGDYGFIDGRGNLFLEGRRDRVFKSGAEKVSLLRIEEVLRATGLCSDVAVYAVEDGLLGKVPWARVVPGNGWDGRALSDAVRRLLPPSHRPKKIVEVEEIPRTGSGKALVHW